MKEKEQNMYSLLKMKREMARALFVISTCLFLSLALSTSALSYHGTTESLYVVNADGKGKKRVAKPDSYSGAWSPDGSMIAYAHSKKNSVKESIYTANADGSNRKKITKGTTKRIYGVSWVSGDKISYTRFKQKNTWGYFGLYVVNKDGTGLKRIIKTMAPIGSFDWSPDGSEVAYTRCFVSCDIYKAHSDGSGKKRIVKKAAKKTRGLTYPAQSLVWSTDGEQIAFVDEGSVDAKSTTISVVNKDGSGKSLLTKLTKRAKPTTLTDVDITSDFKKIAYTLEKINIRRDVYTVNSDGSGFKRVVKSRKGGHPFDVRWSSDGSKIIFAS